MPLKLQQSAPQPMTHWTNTAKITAKWHIITTVSRQSLDWTSKARFILLTPSSRRQSAAQILTHTNIWLVHTPAFDADDLSLRGIRLDGVSICRVQSSWTQASSRRQSLTIIQSQARIHGLISALSLPGYVIWGRSRLQQIVMVEMNAPCCSNGPTRHRISSRISGIMRRYLG